jgi:hypothetical protein
MPPLTTARSRRRFGELVAVVGMAGTLWGPVGSAEAGVSAGSTAKATFSSGAAHAASPGALVGAGPAADQARIIDGPVANRLACPSFSQNPTSFTTKLGNGFTSLAARSCPFTSYGGTTWPSGVTFTVTAWTDDGTKICRGGTYQTASSRWYKTSRGWVWSKTC